MNTRDPLLPIPDVQSTPDTRQLDIDRVGIKGIRHPVRVSDKTGGVQHTVANFNMYVHLPKDPNALPIYSRDAELFIGTVERLEDWLAGVQWAREYDSMLRLSDEKKRGAAEQRERNRQLMRTLKEGRRVEGVEE